MKIGLAHASKLGARAVALAVSQDASHQLVWTAQTGADLLAKLEGLRPDVLLLDIGIANPTCEELTRRIMAKAPLPILLLAERPQEHVFRIYEAMCLGALDAVACPTIDPAGGIRGHEAFGAKLRTVARLLGAPQPSMASAAPRHAARSDKLVAIGASTGGPQAIFDILSALPSTLRIAVVVVQHVECEFSAGFASWLQQATAMRLVLAKPGARAEPGTVLLAASNDHLVMTANGTFTYTVHPQEMHYRPSVDALFRSLADHCREPGVAVLLTGMGRDGAEGMKLLRQSGWRTLAQDEASSVVFGMPKAAIELDAADEVVALPDMARAIARACA